MNITICMGSSCYSRGNGRNIEVIQQLLAQRGLEADVQLVGHLCQDQCRNGPNVTIDGKLYQQVDAGAIGSLLDHHVPK